MLLLWWESDCGSFRHNGADQIHLPILQRCRLAQSSSPRVSLDSAKRRLWLARARARRAALNNSDKNLIPTESATRAFAFQTDADFIFPFRDLSNRFDWIYLFSQGVASKFPPTTFAFRLQLIGRDDFFFAEADGSQAS